ncbi:MAG: hypothetical protein OES24_00340 [Acidimicrobiia bacterium]|nr:hypothetical protein [Acidimicrobiia bacterium]
MPASDPDEAPDDLRDHRLTRPDGRIVAYSEWGDATDRTVLRVPGTPGSRFSVRADVEPWRVRNLRMITTERPGLGASTRLPGRGFNEHADDLAALLTTSASTGFRSSVAAGRRRTSWRSVPSIPTVSWPQR